MQRKELNLDEADEDEYLELYKQVESEISQLRVVLESAEAREKERIWLKGKTSGELDDGRLVDGVIGERNVYKKRGATDQLFGMVQRKPKRLSFVVDVSSSMSFFNEDKRLDRLCAVVVLIMEAFHGLQHKFHYQIVGHSGETAELVLVEMGSPPSTRTERLAVIRSMVRHSRSCQSGDNTLQAGELAVRRVTEEEADDYFVFLVSDANLEGYGISPARLAASLTSNPLVNAYVFFIAEEDTAEKIAENMPDGRAHVVLDTGEMPLLFKNIFSAALLASTPQSRL